MGKGDIQVRREWLDDENSPFLGYEVIPVENVSWDDGSSRRRSVQKVVTPAIATGAYRTAAATASAFGSFWSSSLPVVKPRR